MLDDNETLPSADTADVVEQQMEADRDDGQDEYPHAEESVEDDEVLRADLIRHRP